MEKLDTKKLSGLSPHHLGSLSLGVPRAYKVVKYVNANIASVSLVSICWDWNGHVAFFEAVDTMTKLHQARTLPFSSLLLSQTSDVVIHFVNHLYSQESTLQKLHLHPATNDQHWCFWSHQASMHYHKIQPFVVTNVLCTHTHSRKTAKNRRHWNEWGHKLSVVLSNGSFGFRSFLLTALLWSLFSFVVTTLSFSLFFFLSFGCGQGFGWRTKELWPQGAEEMKRMH